MQTETLKVTGMTSEESAKAAARALASVKGVQSVNVLVAEGSAVVEYDEQRTASQELMAVLAKAGFSGDVQKEMARAQGGCCGGCCS
jgi:copper chaperone CopZ